MPAVITCDLRLNEPRFATLPNIMKAKKKKIETVTAADFVGEEAMKRRLEVLKVEEPAKRKSGVMVKDVDELIDKLKNEAKLF